MLRRIIQLCFLMLGGTLGLFLIPDLLTLTNFDKILKVNNSYVSFTFGALIFYTITFWAINYVKDFIEWVEEFLVKAPIRDIIFGSVGLIGGLFVALLIGFAINAVQVPVINTVAPILLTLLLGYLGFIVGIKKREELSKFFLKGQKREDEEYRKTENHSRIKILDTNVILDGRIADICQTGFLEGPIVIPLFVLEEVQHSADSSDALKRNRGRRGLGALNQLKKNRLIKVEIFDGNFEEMPKVHSKLLKLAKLTNGVVVTNDVNLNKICELQNVSVLNLNHLVNAVKPIVLPSEKINVQVIKDGKEQDQGIAFLDDGTMIVVKDGRDYIGKRIDILVTSVFQTSAGRVIFAKPKLLDKALLY